MTIIDLVSRDLINVDKDAAAIGDLYRKGRSSMVDSIRYLVEAGRRLLAKKDSLDHGEWLPWLGENAEVLKFESRRTASRLMLAAQQWDVNAPLGEAEALRLNRIAWGNNVRGTEGTGDNEWFAPAEYIELARAVLGTIDLDPASSDRAQEVVKAREYFTKESDGLKRDWYGNVWLNPPYAQPLIAYFASKMVEEVKAGRVTQAIMLTHNYTDTTWFHELGSAAKAICFKRGRVRFYEPDDGEPAKPTQGQAFFYFGDDPDKFAELFKVIGLMCRLD